MAESAILPPATNQVQPGGRSVHHGQRDPARLLGSWLRYKVATARGKRQMRTDKKFKRATSYNIPYIGHRGTYRYP